MRAYARARADSRNTNAKNKQTNTRQEAGGERRELQKDGE